MASPLEADLRQLMAALKRNGADDWPGKPEQTPLCMEVASPGLTVEDGLDTEACEAVRGVQVVSSMSSMSSSGGTTSDADAQRHALDRLMSEYVGAVGEARRVQAVDAPCTASATSQTPPPEGPSMQALLDALDSLPPL